MTSNSKLSAVIFGGTGLTGRFLTELLIADARYELITLFVRKEIPTYHGKVRQIIFNQDSIADIKSEISGDQVFCCLGTTIKKAGSKEAFAKTDHHLIVDIAKAALANNIHSFTVISSIGANPDSGNFYLKTKGLTEVALKNLNFSNLIILRPSMLLGLRKESRPLEDIGKSISKALSFLFIGRLRKYKPIHAETVARAMIVATNELTGLSILESDRIEASGTPSYQ